MNMKFNYFFIIIIIRIIMSVIENNIKNCPLKMSDGRSFTNYEPRCARNAYLNNLLVQNNMVNSSYEQRVFLQNNYEKIVEEERKKSLNNLLPCIPCNAGELINETNKELDNKYYVYCDNVSCRKEEGNIQGLGTTKLF
jgi:hypothetical protein